MKRFPKYQVYFSRRSQEWYFRLLGANNRIVHGSEGYTTQASAIRGANTAQRLSALATIVVLK